MKKKFYSRFLGVVLGMSILTSVAFAGVDGVERVKSYKLPGATATSMAVSKDEMKMIVGLGKDGVALLDIRNIKAPYLMKQVKTDSPVVSVAFDGKNTFAGLENGSIALLDMKKGTVLSTRKIGDAPVQLTLSSKDDLLVAVDGFKVLTMEVKGKVEDLNSLTVRNLSSTPEKHNSGSYPALSSKDMEYPTEPNPVRATFSPDGKMIAISLQKNNAIALVDAATGEVTRIFSLGETKHRGDTKNDKNPFVEEAFTGRLEAASVAFSPDGEFIYTANEGSPILPPTTDGVWSGGRNFSIFKVSDGTLIYDGMDKLEQTALMLGAYPDTRSEIRGIEPNGVAVGKIADKPALAISSRYANGVFLFQITKLDGPFFYGMAMSGGRGPVAVTGFQMQDGFMSVDEDGMLSVYMPIITEKETGTGH